MHPLYYGNVGERKSRSCFQRIHGHQKKTLALFVIGIMLSGSAVLQRVAESISLHGINPAKMTSIERRLARFIANDRVVVSQNLGGLFVAGVAILAWEAVALRA